VWHVSVGYLRTRRSDSVSDDGLTAVPPSARLAVQATTSRSRLWIGRVEFSVFGGSTETEGGLDHEATHGREPLSRTHPPTLSLQNSSGTRKSGFL
jgi:hypothetical protein